LSQKKKGRERKVKMHLDSKLCRVASCLVMVMLLLTSCAPTRAAVKIDGYEGYGSAAYLRTFDKQGRPVFLLLSERPTKAGERFSLVEFEDKRPSVSYEIKINNEPSKDYLKPVVNFFKNLGVSLMMGLGLGLILVDELDDAAEDDVDDDKYNSDAFKTGFVIGTGVGLWYTGYGLVNDTSRLVVNKMESVVSETYYSYDKLGRLTSITVFPPKGNQWTSKTTKFVYHGDETVPSEIKPSGDIDDIQTE